MPPQILLNVHLNRQEFKLTNLPPPPRKEKQSHTDISPEVGGRRPLLGPGRVHGDRGGLNSHRWWELQRPSRRKYPVDLMKTGWKHQNDSKTLEFHSVDVLRCETQLQIQRPHGERRAVRNIFGSVVLLLIWLNPHGREDCLELKSDPERLGLASRRSHVTWVLSRWHLFLKPDLLDATHRLLPFRKCPSPGGVR